VKLYLYSSNMPSWRGAQIKAQEQLDGGICSVSSTGRFTLGEIACRYSFGRKLGGPPSQSGLWEEEKIPPLPGIESRSFSPVPDSSINGTKYGELMMMIVIWIVEKCVVKMWSEFTWLGCDLITDVYNTALSSAFHGAGSFLSGWVITNRN
jgi:hypothetical protein